MYAMNSAKTLKRLWNLPWISYNCCLDLHIFCTIKNLYVKLEDLLCLAMASDISKLKIICFRAKEIILILWI